MKPEDYHKAAQAIMPLAAPKDQGLADLKCNADGRFSDKDLAKKFMTQSRNPLASSELVALLRVSISFIGRDNCGSLDFLVRYITPE